MKNKRTAGFTLAEAIIASTITLLALTLSISGLYFVLAGERQNSIQTELDLNVRTAAGWLSSDVRLSAVNKMFFYPQGIGPYTAISFPMAQTNVGGLLAYDANSNLVWNRTVIYHVWAGSPSELRRTEFKATVLTNDIQRQMQLNSVVTNGNGLLTYQSTATTTRVIFKNLFNWSITTKGSVYDGYTATTQRDVAVNFGSVLLTPGNHTFKFTTMAKNQANVSPTGYKIGFDTLVVSPCAGAREAEAQTGNISSQSVLSAVEYMTGGDWSGNHRLLFPASAIGQSITFSLENDRWEETNFKGGQHENTLTSFDTTLTPKDFIVSPKPTKYYTMPDQTLDPTGGATAGDALRGYAVRVLVRGNNMPDGGMLKHSGQLHCMYMWGGVSPLRVLGVYISECASLTDYSMDAMDAGVQLYGDATVPGGTAATYMGAPWATYMIDCAKSYIVSFLVVNNSGQSDAHYWTELHAASGTNSAPPGCWVIPGDYAPTLDQTRFAQWSSYTNVIQTNLLFGLYQFHVQAPTNVYYTSRIVDTQLTTPAYQTMGWNQVVPVNCSIILRVRTSANNDMSGASAWAATYYSASGASGLASIAGLPSRRYIQFQANLKGNPANYDVLPKLRNVTLRWTGQTMIADIGGVFARGPDHGIFEMTVDGAPLARGVTFNLQIFETVFKGGTTQLVKSAVSAEIEPRNTGK